jgi:hypothetical protein
MSDSTRPPTAEEARRKGVEQSLQQLARKA